MPCHVNVMKRAHGRGDRAGRGARLMDDEGFHALEAIGESTGVELADHQRWVAAFKTIRWVVQTEAGLALTQAGRQARDEMAARRRIGGDTSDQRSPPRPRPEPA